MGLVHFVEALEVVLVRLGEGNNQQGCSDDHLGTGILELAAHHPGCNKSKGSPHMEFLGNLGFCPNQGESQFFIIFSKTKFALELSKNVMKSEEKNVL